ncbi:cyclic GMP-AMP synthase [Mesocricetus auratus]|uniref:Cyclic GMP-AMP synthase n=1 Tax=Mesocricetus auratus TaxID=10036 RepID=A0ABM2WZD9_MESAU|nr:cyclic GMP-AMP synthase [Mesocricetus auratus]
MEGQCRRPTASRAKKPAEKRATTEPSRTVAALSHAGSYGPQRGARSRRAEPEGDPTEKLRARVPPARAGRVSVRTKDLQPSATGAAGDAEPPTVQPAVPEPQPPAVPEAQPPADPEAPAVARGPSRRRGARSVRQPRAPRGSRKEQNETPDRKLKKVLEKLRLKREEISVAAEVVNGVVKHLLSRLRNRESEFKGVQQLNTGSYYEHVKISAPNEFDVMFKLEVPRIQLQEYRDTGAFYLVKLGRIPRGNPLAHFLVDEILSASKMLSKFREIIKEEVKEIKGIDVSVEKEKPGSPAVTLLIRNPEEISVDIILALESKGSWPVSTKEGLPIKNWLGTKVRTNLRREPFYLVPKNAKVGNGFQGKTWRLSFSHTEKYILNNHGIEKTCCESAGVKCCRKDCLKLMKYLLEQLKKEYEELDAFCSYHVKTAIFHMWTEKPQDSQWDPKHLSTCFDDFLTFFAECLRTETLMHYFIPKFNLFSQELIDQNSKEFLSTRIEYERNNGFPIFDKF